MNSNTPVASVVTRTAWLICLIAAIGFAFDTYELLMLPLIAGPALSELLQVPANHPMVTNWVGRLLWMTALCGGVFGLLGGWLTDRLGRKTVLAGSIALYSLSPVCAALSTSLTWFVIFRCATFVGVCVEFVAAITWLAEVFPEKRQREKALGWTQAFASIGGLLVTGVNVWILKHAADLPLIGVAEPFNGHAFWRYTLISGLMPAIPIALLLPFVPESPVWVEKRRTGTLRRPNLGELFSPQLRRVTLVTAALSACAYAAAFGALQLTPTRVVPGLADLAPQRQVLKPLQEDAKKLNEQLTAALPAFQKATSEVPGLVELSGQRAKLRIALRTARRPLEALGATAPVPAALQSQLTTLSNRMGELDKKLNDLTGAAPDAKKALLDREKWMGQIAGNREKQSASDEIIKQRGNTVQLWQELGGLGGRIALALLVATALSRGRLLRLFQLPALLLFPLTYLYLFRSQPEVFQWGMALCGFVVVAQFSYFGEYLPKVFPLHLRGTGGSFATNVGGRMFGTSAAYATSNLIAPAISANSTFEQVATAAAFMGGGVMVLGFCLSFLLPEPMVKRDAE